MASIRIVPYCVSDNNAALSLERECPQGKSLILNFRRPTFHARSEVYENYRILCAKVENELVGIAAWAKKCVTFHGEKIRAAYVYDVRVHPSHRKYGTAKKLSNAIREDIGQNVDCIYTLIAGENERALGLARRCFGAQTVLPLTYAVIPVCKTYRLEKNPQLRDASDIHRMYLKHYREIEFLPAFEESRLLGYVSSISCGSGWEAGSSIWTNENLLAEQIVRIPLYYSIVNFLTAPLRLFVTLPRLPKVMETIHSWFLFDFYAKDKQNLRTILKAINNFAFTNGRKFLYILFQYHDPVLELLKDAGSNCLTVPYYFLANGRAIPTDGDRIYIDVKDL